MDSSDKATGLPPAPVFSHRLPFHNHHHRRPHHHHQCLELSPHCPQHGGYLWRPNSHHRHRNAPTHADSCLELSPDCPLHGNLLPPCPLHCSKFQSTTNFPIFPNFAPSIPLPPSSQLSNPIVNDLNSIPPAADVNLISETLMMGERNEEIEDDEEEVIFVLTDEWKEFFAKSEAKRRLAKKQAKKKG